MNVVLFSRTGVHYADTRRGDSLALFVPAREQVRRFNDIPNVNPKSVRDRYGDVGQTPLWRMDGNSVVVYGLLPEALAERRYGLEVFLPDDFVPTGCSVFYFVFGEKWVIHGVRTVTDDGVEVWGISKIDAGEGSAVSEVVSSVSERLFSGLRENICIAAHGSDTVMEELRQALQPFNLDVVRFDSLSKGRDKDPLYTHRDYGLLMLIAAMMAFIIFGAAVAFTAKGLYDSQKVDSQIANLQEQIRRTQTSTRLGNIKNPKDILSFMSKPLKQRPSAILHSAGDVAAVFGSLVQLEMIGEDAGGSGSRASRRQGGAKASKAANSAASVMTVMAQLAATENALFLDQERVAQSALVSRPWVRNLQREPGGTGTTITLRIGVQVE